MVLVNFGLVDDVDTVEERSVISVESEYRLGRYILH